MDPVLFSFAIYRNRAYIQLELGQNMNITSSFKINIRRLNRATRKKSKRGAKLQLFAPLES